MPECPVAAVLAAGAAALAQPRLRRLAEELRAGPEPDPAARYRRVGAALLAAAELAAAPGGDAVGTLLRSDEMADARMRVALAVLDPLGAAVDGADPLGAAVDGADSLGAAVGWQRYARGPVTPLHAACAGDVVQALLRRRSRRAPVRRTHLAALRVLLIGQARASCAALRTELCRAAAVADPRRSASFRESARRRAEEAMSRLNAALDWELAGTAPTGAPGVPDPPLRTAALEHRLTTLLGVGFGVGTALTIARFAGELLGGPPSLVTVSTVLGGMSGLALGGWVARTRRLLVERAAMERWAGEFAAGLRVAMEERVGLRVLVAAAGNAD